MITRTIKVGVQDVNFACSAVTPVIYRTCFGTDMFRDMSAFSKGNIDMEVIEKLAYATAKQADKEMTLSFEEWLDQFGLLDLADDKFLDKFMDFIAENNRTDSTSKKK